MKQKKGKAVEDIAREMHEILSRNPEKIRLIVRRDRTYAIGYTATESICEGELNPNIRNPSNLPFHRWVLTELKKRVPQSYSSSAEYIGQEGDYIDIIRKIL